MLDAARLQRHHVVLDLNAGSGPAHLGDPAARAGGRAPGRWPGDRQAGEGLRQQAERLPELERPVVLGRRGPEELPELLALRGEADLRFDAIVGRNALGRAARQGAATLRLLAGWLQPGGRLSLAETVVRHTQRLYDLVDLSTWAMTCGSAWSRQRRRSMPRRTIRWSTGMRPTCRGFAWAGLAEVTRAGKDAGGRDARQPGHPRALV